MHHDAGRWPACNIVMHYTTSCNTQSNAAKDGQNNCPKNFELTRIINKPLLLHLVGCLYYLYFIIFFLRPVKRSQLILLQNVVYFITLPVLVRKIFTFYINDVLLFKCPFPGQELKVCKRFFVFRVLAFKIYEFDGCRIYMKNPSRNKLSESAKHTPH